MPVLSETDSNARLMVISVMGGSDKRLDGAPVARQPARFKTQLTFAPPAGASPETTSC